MTYGPILGRGKEQDAFGAIALFTEWRLASLIARGRSLKIAHVKGRGSMGKEAGRACQKESQTMKTPTHLQGYQAADREIEEREIYRRFALYWQAVEHEGRNHNPMLPTFSRHLAKHRCQHCRSISIHNPCPRCTAPKPVPL